MNALQEKELEILKCFIDICEKLELRYYLVCGSALGAVKYKGFIPWDDDVDVALPRADYEKFLYEAPKLLPEYLFLQNYKTDPQFPKIFTKLRDSRTTYVETAYRKLKMHHGVFIDIFPLDGYPDNIRESLKFEKKKKKYLRITSCSLLSDGSLKSRAMRFVLRCFGFHKCTGKNLARYDNMIQAYEYTGFYCNYGNFRTDLEKIPKEIYGEGAVATFEGVQVRVPLQYDIYLRKKYGDYHKDPPIEAQVGHHYYVALNLHEPCKKYMSEKSRYNPRKRRI